MSAWTSFLSKSYTVTRLANLFSNNFYNAKFENATLPTKICYNIDLTSKLRTTTKFNCALEKLLFVS